MQVPPQTRVGDLRRISVSLPQAAQILRIDVDRVRKAVDRHIVTATLVWQGKRQVRKLDGVDVLCLRMGRVLKADLRQDLYVQLKQAPDRALVGAVFDPANGEELRTDTRRILGFLNQAAAETVADLQTLDAVSEHIDDAGRIRGADVEAHRIAALIEGGMRVDDVIADYPGLAAAPIEAARIYARANPKQGRPYPACTAKSVLRAGGGGGLATAFAAARDDASDS